MDIDDGEHALMPKLKNIYHTADKSYKDYLSRNPLKILENLKTVSDGREVTLESFLAAVEPQQTTVIARPVQTVLRPGQRVTPTLQKRAIPRMEPHPHHHTAKRLNQQQEGEYASPSSEKHEVKQEPKAPKEPSRIELRIQEEHLEQTTLLNINEAFKSIDDLQSRLLPFHCSAEPGVSLHDEEHAENGIMEPFCVSLLERKRRLEQSARSVLNRIAAVECPDGEALLMERLGIELERDALKEERLRKAEEERHEAVRSSERRAKKDLNHNQNTVQPALEDIDEHDNAVKGLLDAF